MEGFFSPLVPEGETGTCPAFEFENKLLFPIDWKQKKDKNLTQTSGNKSTQKQM